MDTSLTIAMIVFVIFALELWGLRSGSLQDAVRDNAIASGVVVAISLAVLLTISDKLLGGSGVRYVFYGVLLLFNVGLFGMFFAKRLRELHRQSD